MKINEITNLVENTALLDKLSNYASMHYGEKNKKDALLMLLARAAMHSKKDDTELKVKVSNIEDRIKDLESNSKSNHIPPTTQSPDTDDLL